MHQSNEPIGGGQQTNNTMNNRFKEFLAKGQSIYKVEHHKVQKSDRWISITRDVNTNVVGISYMQEAQDYVYNQFATKYATPHAHLSAFYMNLTENFESNKDYDCHDIELQSIDDAIWLYFETMNLD